MPERHDPVKPAPIVGQAPAFGAVPTMQTPLPAEKVPEAVPPPPAPTPAPAPQPGESDVPPIQSLHTMKNDLQDVVRERKISLVQAASMEQDRRAKDPVPDFARAAAPKRHIGVMITATLLLIALGGVAIYAVYSFVQGGTAAQDPATSGILFAEKQLTLPISGTSPNTLKQTLGNALTQGGALGTIVEIIPTVQSTSTAGQSRATLSQFFAAIGAQPPADLMRALSDQFFFGIHMATDGPGTLFIIPVLSYDHAFAGMLTWESSMDSDLSPLFKQVPSLTPAPGGGLPGARVFKDMVMRNYDMRVLQDDAGSTVLYYSFPTPNLLIIAASTYTFPEVLSRLQAARSL